MTAARTNLFDLTRSGMEAFTAQVDDKPYRTHQIMKWAYHQRQLDFDGMTNLSKVYRSWLAEHAEFKPPEVVARYDSVDGTVKWVVRVANGNCVETTALPGGRHRVRWEDPFDKPCYLFALVALFTYGMNCWFLMLVYRLKYPQAVKKHQNINNRLRPRCKHESF